MLLLLFDFSAFTSTTFFYLPMLRPTVQQTHTHEEIETEREKKLSNRTYFSIRCSYMCGYDYGLVVFFFFHIVILVYARTLHIHTLVEES